MKTYIYTFFLAFIISLSAAPVSAQLLPVQNQFFVNPYVYNAAFATEAESANLYVAGKKQWLGVEGSPTIASVSYTHPLTSKMSLGGFVNNITEGPFNNLTALFTAGYDLQLSKQLDQHLYFGLSVGFNWNNLNTNKFDDPNDPAIANYTTSGINLEGAIGLVYSVEKLRVGISLPRINNAAFFANESGSVSTIEPLSRLIGSVSYTFEFEPSMIALTPYVLYHYNKRFDGQLEGMLQAAYNNKIRAGLGYRQNYGINCLIGANIGAMFNLNYIYTFTSSESDLLQDSHELVLGLRFK